MIRNNMSQDYTGKFTNNPFITENAELNDSINEALGISNEVEKEVEKIGDIIIKYVKNLPISYRYNDFYPQTKDIKSVLFGEEMIFKLQMYFFKDIETYFRNKDIIQYFFQYSNDTKTVFITIVVINKDVVFNSLTTKLAHEIRHTLQYNKTKRKLLHSKSYYQNVYDSTGKKTNGDISEIIYLCSPYEQEAYGQELYNELLYYALPFKLQYKKCNGWQAYERLVKLINWVKNNPKDPKIINDITKRGYTVEEFLVKAENGRKKFIRRLGRAIVQAEKDKISFNER